MKLGLVGLAFFVGILVLVRRLQPAAARVAAADPTAGPALRALQSPLAAASTVTVGAMILASSAAPAFVRDLAVLVAAPPTAWIAIRVVGPSVARTVCALATSLALYPLRGAMEVSPITQRLFLLLQVLPVGIALVADTRARRWIGLSGSDRAERVLEFAAWSTAASLGVAVVGVVVGWVELAGLLRTGALGTLGGVILGGASYLVLTGLWSAILASRRAQSFRVVRLHHGLAASVGRRVLGFLALGLAAWSLIFSFHFEMGFARAVAATSGPG